MTSKELDERLRALSDLPIDWDGSAAPAPSAIAIQRANDVARALPTLPNAIDPDPNGGVGIWYYGRERRDVACYCRNNGDVTIVTYRSGMWRDQINLRFSVTASLTIEHVKRSLVLAIAATQEQASSWSA